MKTKLLFLVVLLVVTLSVDAQKSDEKQFKFGAGATLGLPIGDITRQASLALGVDILGEYAVAPEIALTLSAGYNDWAKKSGVNGNWGFIPVMAGGKYYFTDQIYGSLQAGISFWADGTKSEFVYAPGVGYKITDKFDLLLKYQSQSNKWWGTTFFGLRVGYSF
jgi:hypothetical protein